MNKVHIIGKVKGSFTFEFENYGEKFYRVYLAVKRVSENVDVLPVIISNRIIDVTADWEERYLEIDGQYRSFNKHENGKTHLDLTVFCKDVQEVDEDNVNEVFLDGYICKNPKYRETPLGRKLAEVIIVVKRSYGKPDYIPCICWGRNARFASSFEVGTHVQITGRIQSREYVKKISDTEVEQRVAYEVSVSRLE